MKAIKSIKLGHAAVVEDIPIPSLEGNDGYVLVKTEYLGLNPADWILTDLPIAYTENNTIGADFSGTVVKAGPAVTKFKVGDKIAGYTYANNLLIPNGGCFAEYAVAKGDAMVKVENLDGQVSLAEAAILGVALCTIFTGLYIMLGLPWPRTSELGTLAQPDPERAMILIYGGSSATGMMAIQFAKLSGMTVITTCSPKNFDLVKKLGADVVFDYHDSKRCAEDIRAFAGDDLKLVFDCFSAFHSPTICAEVISSSGGVYNAVNPVEFPRKDVESLFTRGQKANGEPFNWAETIVPGDAEAFETGNKFITLAETLLKEKKIIPPPIEIVNGLESIPDTMQLLREWKASAKKYVCCVDPDAK